MRRGVCEGVCEGEEGCVSEEGCVLGGCVRGRRGV